MRTRGLAGSGAACLAALAIAGCGAGGSSSASKSSALTIAGHTLSIYLSEPGNLNRDPVAQDIVHAEQRAFAAHAREVRDYRLALVPVRTGTLTSHARAAIIDPTTIAYLGEVAPGASDDTVGITNALDVLQVSPTDTALELSDVTPGVSGGPKSLFESWSTYGRTFARVAPSGTLEARAEVAEMRSLGARSLYVGADASVYGRAIADAVRRAARGAGVTIAATPAAAAAVFYGAQSPAAAAAYFNRVARTAPQAKLFGPSALNSGLFAAALSPAVRHLYISLPGYLPRDLPAGGRSFVRAFTTAYGHAPNVEAIFGYEAMSALLHVLQSEGTRANNRTNVVGAFLRLRRVDSVLGRYSIDAAGNTSLDAFVFARVRGGRLVPFAAAPR